jgi:hypothetical protein
MDDSIQEEPSDDGTTNDDRASWAEVALLVFAQRTGTAKEMVGDKEDPFLIVSDLLADLGHWCDRHGVDLPLALVHAAQHYLAETDGTGKQFNS